MDARRSAFLDSFAMKVTYNQTDNILYAIAMTYLYTVQHIWDKLADIAKYPISWIAGFFLFLMNAVTGGTIIIYVIILASFIDLGCGIAVSRRQGTFTRSDLMRQTVEKVTVYGLAMIIFLSLDKYIMDRTDFTLALSSGLVGVVIVLVETVSFLASLLILYPSNAFLRLLMKVLKSEIAAKLHVDETEVSSILDSMVKKHHSKKQPRNNKGQFTKKNG